jgi:phage terminase Nu1 subunit (DNA packaging protein)
MSPLTQAQAAEIVGLTARRLRQLQDEGTGPAHTAGGQYDPKEVGRWYRQRLLSEMGVANDGQAYDYEAERARLTKAQADKTELEAAELAGSLVRVDEVEAEWSRMLGSMRSRLLSLPSKAGPRVRVALNDEEAAALIEAEILEALQELSTDGIPPTTRDRRVRAEARAEGSAPAAEADGKPVGGPVPAPVRRKRGRAGAVEN